MPLIEKIPKTALCESGGEALKSPKELVSYARPKIDATLNVQLWMNGRIVAVPVLFVLLMT